MFFETKELKIKKKVFNYKIKTETKTTTATALKYELKYSPMSEGTPKIKQ